MSTTGADQGSTKEVVKDKYHAQNISQKPCLQMLKKGDEWLNINQRLTNIKGQQIEV